MEVCEVARTRLEGRRESREQRAASRGKGRRRRRGSCIRTHALVFVGRQELVPSTGRLDKLHVDLTDAAANCTTELEEWIRGGKERWML